MSQEIDFKSLNLPVSDLIKNYTKEIKKEIYDYLNEMDENNKKAYSIAYDHLGSSFNILRSNGFKEWKHSKKIN
jgi:hypothetical protein